MPPDPQKVQSIFHEAVEQHAASQWPAFLDHACGSDVELRRAVEALLRGHEQANSLLDEPAPSSATADALPTAEPGSVIGPYKLIEQIGEGGMGTVWMAQQTEPVKRVVALKLIKAGMDSKQVIARFEAERQALALMDHPNIAKVFDGGMISHKPEAPAKDGPTPSLALQACVGRSYFVMELVKGVPITKYCDEHRLTPRQRLELFIPVCQAVQHAHQKGIIHRDLKPSNVLVALYDGKPVPKVIDFGVAKAAGQPLTEQTLVTGFGAIVGTLEYMSPEQAEINQLDVDTRSDIYSLGVLLYELLAGSPPFTRKELEKAGMLEMLRVIREQEPSKPSTKLSTAEGLPTLAANRGTEPAKLTKLVRGELDWIVMKALEKDRSRRYETANGSAMDVQRYLADEPVLACPPSWRYRLGKFARRNKRALVAAVVLGGAILVAVGAVAGSIGWVARDQAARQLVLEQEIGRALEETEDWYRRDKLPEAVAALRRAEGLLATGAIAEELGQRVRQWRADLEMVNRLDEARLDATTMKDDQFDPLPETAGYREAFHRYGLAVDQLEPEQAAPRIRASAVSDRLVVAVDQWARIGREERLPETDRLLAVARRADSDPVRERIRKAWWGSERDTATDLARDEHVLAQAPDTIGMVAGALNKTGQSPLALELLRQAQLRYPSDFWINIDLAYSLGQVTPPRYDEAIAFYRVAVALRPESPGARRNLAVALERQGDLDQAAAQLREAVRLKPDFAAGHAMLGATLGQMGDRAGALAALREALGLRPDSASVRYDAGRAFRRLGMLDETTAEFREALRLKPNYVEARTNLGIALSDKGLHDQAAAQLREAVRRKPDFAPAQAVLGDTLGVMGDREGAVAALREAIRLKPDSPFVRCRAGDGFRHLRMLDEAIAEYREALRLWPNFVAAHTNLGIALYDKGLNDEAIAVYRTAIRLNPYVPQPRVNLGNALLKKGLIDEVLAEARELIRRHPDYALAYHQLGSVAYKKGDWDEAIAQNGKAIELDPKLANAHAGIGNALERKGFLDQAIAAYRQAIRVEPDFAHAHIMLGSALRAQGKPDEAIAEYRKAIELDPTNASAHDNLGYTLHVRLKKVDEAIVSYRRAIELNPKYAHAHMNLGNALRDQGKAEEAIAAYRKAIDLDPKIAYAHIQLHRLLQAKGRLDEAVAMYRAELRRDPKDDFVRTRLAWSLNDWAWDLATHAEPHKRDPGRAVRLAKEAVEVAPQNPNCWNTLGAAYYRAGNWNEAIAALQNYRELRKDDGEWSNPFFLAMAHWQRGEKREARKWFDKGVEWMDRKNVRTGMTPRVRAEAAKLLGIQDKKEPGTKKQESEQKPD